MNKVNKKIINVEFNERLVAPCFSNLIKVDQLDEQTIINFAYLDYNDKHNATGIARIVISSDKARQLGERLLENNFNSK